MYFGEVIRWLLLLSVSAWKSPTGGKLLILQKSFLCWNFAACRRLARSVGSWLLHCCVEHLKGLRFPGSQIKAKGSIWLGRKEKRVLPVVTGKLSSESVDRGCSYLECESPQNTAAESGDTDLSAQPGRGFSIHHRMESNAEPNRANFKEMPVKHWSTALNMNPGGTPF